MRWGQAAIGLLALLVSPLSALAQSFAAGDIARNVGLGGGGIAIFDEEASFRANPAAAAVPVRCRLRLAGLGLYADGPRSLDAWSSIIQAGSFDPLQAEGYPYLADRNRLGARAEGAWESRRWRVGLAGVFAGESDPSAPLRQWIRQGAVFTPPPGSRADVGYLVAIVPSATTGWRRQLGGGFGGTLDVGARANIWAGSVRRYVYSAPPGQGLQQTRSSRVDALGIGIDLGMRYRPSAVPRLSLGWTLDSAVEPSMSGAGEDRTLSVGAAYVVSPRLLLVMDALNLNGPAHRDFRFSAGAELRLRPGGLRVRGAATTRGLAAGLRIGPIDLAYATDGQTTLGSVVRF